MTLRFLERDWCCRENIFYLVHRAERNVVRFVYELVTLAIVVVRLVTAMTIFSMLAILSVIFP